MMIIIIYNTLLFMLCNNRFQDKIALKKKKQTNNLIFFRISK